MDALGDMQDFFEFLFGLYRTSRRAVGYRWTVQFGRTSFRVLPATGERLMLLITDTQKVTLSIQPVDLKGFPAKLDGMPEWSVSDAAVGTLNVAPDGLSAVFMAGAPGMAQVNVSADADLGAGVKTIAGTLDVQVEPGEAVSLTVTTSAPEAQ